MADFPLEFRRAPLISLPLKEKSTRQLNHPSIERNQEEARSRQQQESTIRRSRSILPTITLLGIFLVAFSTPAVLGGQGVVEYFLDLPADAPFLEGTTAELIKQMKEKSGRSFIDTKNGYMFLEGDGGQRSLQIVLFRYRDKRPLLAVAWGDAEEAPFTDLLFYTKSGKKMVPVKRSIFPVAAAKNRRFILPREGRTVKVTSSSGRGESSWIWDGEAFQQAK